MLKINYKIEETRFNNTNYIFDFDGKSLIVRAKNLNSAKRKARKWFDLENCILKFVQID